VETNQNALRVNPYWSQPLEAVMAQLHGTAAGLSAEDASRRLEEFGPNSLEARKKATALGLFLDQLKSPLVLILLFAAIVSAIVEEWVDPRSSWSSCSAALC